MRHKKGLWIRNRILKAAQEAFGDNSTLATLRETIHEVTSDRQHSKEPNGFRPTG